MQSDPVVLGSLRADTGGLVNASLSIPTGAAAGTHTLTLSGTGADGTARSVATEFTVADPGGSTPSGALARTGAQILRLLWNGGLLVLAGCLFLLVGLRQRAQRRFPNV